MIQPEQIAGKSILAFWDKDIPYLKYALNTFDEKPILAPMESRALRVFPGGLSNFFLPDCLLSQADIDRSGIKGRMLIDKWVRACGEYSWAAYASNSLKALLPSLFTIELISKALLEKNINEFCSIIPYNPSHALQWFSADIPKFVFKDKLYGKFRAIPLTEQEERMLASLEIFLNQKRGCALQQNINDFYDYAQMEGSELFIIYEIDIHRFKKVIEAKKAEGKKVVVLLYTGNSEHGQRALDAYDVPVLLRPYIDSAGLDAQDEHELQLLGGVLGAFPETARMILGGMINQYHTLKNLYAVMQYLFEQHPPATVFVSYGQASGFRVTEKAAEDAGIPLFNIMHASYMDRVHRPLHKKATMLVGFELVKDVFLKENPAQPVEVTELMRVGSEYEMPEKCEVENQLVLIVQAICQQYPALDYADGMSRRIQTLNELMQIPESLKGKITLLCKSHPSWYEGELYRRVQAEQGAFLPANSNLDDLLDRASLIIGLNYCGSPLLQGIERKIPVLVFQNVFDEVCIDGGGFLEAMRKAGVFFSRKIPEIWAEAESILSDAARRNEVLMKQEAIRLKLKA